MSRNEVEVEVIYSAMHGGNIMLVPDYFGRKHPVIDGDTGKVSVFDTTADSMDTDFQKDTRRRARAMLRLRMWRIFGVKPEDVTVERPTTNTKSASDDTLTAEKLDRMMDAILRAYRRPRR